MEMWSADKLCAQLPKYRAAAHVGGRTCSITWLRKLRVNGGTPAGDAIERSVLCRPLRSTPVQMTLLPPYAGGCTNLAIDRFAGKKVGIVVAGNSGRPGGACGHVDAVGGPYVDKLHHNHGTQEEDVVSNWLLTHEEREGTPPKVLFAKTIGGKRRWGMLYPDWTGLGKRHGGYQKKVFYTKQKIDYRYAKPIDYQDAWHVSNCLVSTKTKTGYDHHGQFIRCSLVFVAGPLANTSCARPPPHPSTHPPIICGDYCSTRFRTLNYKCVGKANYRYFKACVRETFHAALLAMALRGDTIAVLCHVSGGIYAGDHRSVYGDGAPDTSELESIVNDILQNSNVFGKPLGCYFEQVVFAPNKSAASPTRPKRTSKLHTSARSTVRRAARRRSPAW